MTESKIILVGGYFDGQEIDAPAHGDQIKMLTPAQFLTLDANAPFDAVKFKKERVVTYTRKGESNKWILDLTP